MSKILVVYPEKCAGCHTCELMCSFEHKKVFNPRLSAVTVVDFEAARTAVPIMCMQCDEACCLKVCPVNAISRNEDGVVAANPDKCIVCKMCISACPLGCINYSASTGEIIKCDLCDGDPKCVQFCSPGAISYVDSTESSVRKKAIAEQFSEVFGGEASS